MEDEDSNPYDVSGVPTPEKKAPEPRTERTIGEGSLLDDSAEVANKNLHAKRMEPESIDVDALLDHYALYLGHDIKLLGREGGPKMECVYFKIRVLTPFDDLREPYKISIPIGDALEIFKHVKSSDTSWKDDGRMRKFEGYEGFGPGLLVVEDNVAFRSLENKLFGESVSLEDSDSSGSTDYTGLGDAG